MPILHPAPVGILMNELWTLFGIQHVAAAGFVSYRNAARNATIVAHVAHRGTLEIPDRDWEDDPTAVLGLVRAFVDLHAP